MQGKMKKEELPVYRTPNGLGKIIHIVAWGILFGLPFSKVICVSSSYPTQ